LTVKLMGSFETFTIALTLYSASYSTSP
jgi:hypothetical protein